MPINNQLYKSIVPINNDATRTYSRERIERINADKLYVTIGGKKVLKSSLNLNKGTLKEIPSDYVEKANKKDAVLEKIGWQNKAGKPAILQGLAKTVGASAAMATGAAYSTPVVGTLGGLARNIVAGGVGAEGFAMLDGRPATKEEIALGAGMEMGMPMVMKGATSIIKPIQNGLKNITDYLNAPKFKTNPEAYYRVIGNEEGLNDAIISNTLRPNQNGIFKDRSTYYTKGAVNDKSNPVIGGGAKKGTAYEGKYIAEVLPGTNYPQVAKELNPEWNFGLTRNGEHIPTSSENVRLYKKDWLKGYREITKPVSQASTTSIKSKEIIKTTPFQIEQPTTNTLQLKSTMIGSPLEKQLSKDGMLSINSLQAHLNNPSTSIADKTMIRKVLDEKFAGQPKINYNDFRKAVSDEMVPLEKNFDSNYSDYGVGSLGYPGVKKESIEKAIGYGKQNVANAFSIRNTSSGSRADVKIALEHLRKNKKLLSEIPKENTSIVYSNKDKFGRGSTDHFENEGTLGHSRILVSNEEKDVMHVLEQQSDFYQKHSPEEIGMSEELMKNINRLDKDLSAKKDILHKMKTEGIDFYGNPIKPNDIPEMESLIKQQSEINKLANADLSNITQKSLLGKTHQERLLQENVAHAAQNGQTKMRYPTPETAAKIQGYKRTDSSLVEKEITELKNNQEFDVRTISWDTKRFIVDELDVRILDIDNTGNGSFTPRKTSDIVADIESKNGFNILKERGNGYSKEHQTILKKYADNPKMIKKILGQDTRTVTDSKGNSWYEFDIPEAFRKGKAEIKALSTIGAIATGYKEIVDKNKNK